jgi:Uncharacterized conserved protein (DUF2303)
MNGYTTAYSPMDLAAVIEKVQGLAEPVTIDLPSVAGLPLRSGAQLVALPKGLELKDLSPFIEKYLHRPIRIREHAQLDTLDSLVDYANRFKTPVSALFADATSLTAAIDWHGQGPEALPDFVTHRAVYGFPLSSQFLAWHEATKLSLDPQGMMDQATFATFLEDHIWDIDNPPVDWMMLPREQLDLLLELLNLRDDVGERDAAGNYILPEVGADRDPDALDDDEDAVRYVPRAALYKLRQLKVGTTERIAQLAQGIEISVDQKVVSRYDPRSGMKELSFSEDHTGSNGRKVRVPQLLLLNIPVFDRGKPHLLPVRLFYRIRGGRVFWGVELMKTSDLIRRAIETAARDAATRTGLPLFFGNAPVDTAG